MTVAQFHARYMLPNRPVLIDISELTSEWRVFTDWVDATAPGAGSSDRRTLNHAHLRENFGGAMVTTYDCSAKRVMGRLPHSEMPLAQYLDWWEGKSPQQLEEVSSCGAEEPVHSRTDQKLYLKDWNFAKENPDYKLYTCPAYFKEDWLNEHEQDHASDHRFVYLGPAGTFTPLHKDVLNSFRFGLYALQFCRVRLHSQHRHSHCVFSPAPLCSWSVNLIGRKRWWMLPPGSEDALTHPTTGKMPFDLRDALDDLQPCVSTAATKKVAKLGSKALMAGWGQELAELLLPQEVKQEGDETVTQLLEFEQGEDEVLFVPSGWWHQVLNEAPTLSINHNWLNAANVPSETGITEEV